MIIGTLPSEDVLAQVLCMLPLAPTRLRGSYIQFASLYFFFLTLDNPNLPFTLYSRLHSDCINKREWGYFKDRLRSCLIR